MRITKKDAARGFARAELVLVAAAVLAAPVFAETPAGPEPAAVSSNEPTTLEVITVTGTHIRRADVATASPLTVVNSDEIKYQGTTAVENTLNRLPQFTADSNENAGRWWHSSITTRP